ncbi:dynamin family protein [Pseudoneobacillus sp. C159]
MIQKTKQLDQSELQDIISSLYSYVHKQNNLNLEKKLGQLAEKTRNQEYSIAFCGHFSAGKSTMINRLIGENLLPSSPIPTSANLVKVKTGEEYAKVYFKKEIPRMYLPPYDYEQVKNYCKDGDQIEWVEISHSDSNLPKGIVILDTPGIDSTDDAHRIASESALHLADLIFYVMDYNHVQSEVNFLFTKDLTIAGKEIYLVINQIDKHRNEELSFHAFQKSVEDSFASWGVKPKGIFYTSLKVPTHPENQYEALQTFITQRFAESEELLQESLTISLKQLANEHLLWLEEQNADKKEQAYELLDRLPKNELEMLEESGGELSNQIQSIDESLLAYETEITQETEKILKNAYLMPFQTRELAKSFLEANQKGFKVGLLFSKQKTETERENRLKQFFEDLQEKISTQIDWHLRGYFQKVVKEMNIQDPECLQISQSYQTPFSTELLVGNVKSGAVLSGEYLLNYTNDVVLDITRAARKEINGIAEKFHQAIVIGLKEQRKKLQDELDHISPYLTAKQTLSHLATNQDGESKAVANILAGEIKELHFKQTLFTASEEEVEIVRESQKLMVKPENSYDSSQVETFKSSPLGTINKKHIIDHLKKTARELTPIHGFEHRAKELMEKASRIENQGFTVALFGAFSAGKSSFANALMGADILPVSPNPTTAAINKILPINEQYQHGTVRVKLKDVDQLLAEVGRSLKVFDLEATEFQGALSQIEKIINQSDNFIGNEKIHFSFLNAFRLGYSNVSHSLGEIIQTDINDFRDFVANETKSCFVEWIELYYDCELTRKGITLVDTPGADSINARHTGVAFDYIKNSDAILFVTYYNHAFSKADREFLIQLGRVKESFELDKMFFIINACDLANSDEELQTVKSYVEQQLLQYGIRQPHLYGLSSLLALRMKLAGENHSPSGMNDFEGAFYQFIANDLLQTSLASAERDIERIISEINVLIEASHLDDSVRLERKNQLNIEHKKLRKYLMDQSSSYLEMKVLQELKELLFYINQRVFLRFGDFFKESFNPSVLKDDGRNLKKALQAAMDEFLLSFGYDFSQELRATSLRMDAFLRKQLTDYHQTLSNGLKETNPAISLSLKDFEHNRHLEFQNAFDQINRDILQRVLVHFKSPKAFFEKNEKKKMSDELYEVLQQPAEIYLQLEGERLQDLYGQLLREEFTDKIETAINEVDAFYKRYLSSLENTGQGEELSNVLTKIEGYSS